MGLWHPVLDVLGWVAGEAWPNGDEDRVREQANAWAAAAAAVNDLIPDVHTVKNKLAEAYAAGDGSEAMQQKMNQLLASGDNQDSSLQTLANQCTELHNSSLNMARSVEQAKLMIISTLTWLAWDLLTCEGVPGGEIEAAADIEMTRLACGAIARRLITNVLNNCLTHGLQMAAMSAVQDGLVQGILNGEGLQHGFDLDNFNELKDAFLGGLFGGTGAGLGSGVASEIGKSLDRALNRAATDESENIAAAGRHESEAGSEPSNSAENTKDSSPQSSNPDEDTAQAHTDTGTTATRSADSAGHAERPGTATSSVGADGDAAGAGRGRGLARGVAKAAVQLGMGAGGGVVGGWAGSSLGAWQFQPLDNHMMVGGLSAGALSGARQALHDPILAVTDKVRNHFGSESTGPGPATGNSTAARAAGLAGGDTGGPPVAANASTHEQAVAAAPTEPPAEADTEAPAYADPPAQSPPAEQSGATQPAGDGGAISSAAVSGATTPTETRPAATSAENPESAIREPLSEAERSTTAGGADQGRAGETGGSRDSDRAARASAAPEEPAAQPQAANAASGTAERAAAQSDRGVRTHQADLDRGVLAARAHHARLLDERTALANAADPHPARLAEIDRRIEHVAAQRLALETLAGEHSDAVHDHAATGREVAQVGRQLKLRPESDEPLDQQLKVLRERNPERTPQIAAAEEALARQASRSDDVERLAAEMARYLGDGADAVEPTRARNDCLLLAAAEFERRAGQQLPIGESRLGGNSFDELGDSMRDPSALRDFAALRRAMETIGPGTKGVVAESYHQYGAAGVGAGHAYYAEVAPDGAVVVRDSGRDFVGEMRASTPDRVKLLSAALFDADNNRVHVDADGAIMPTGAESTAHQPDTDPGEVEGGTSAPLSRIGRTVGLLARWLGVDHDVDLVNPLLMSGLYQGLTGRLGDEERVRLIRTALTERDTLWNRLTDLAARTPDAPTRAEHDAVHARLNLVDARLSRLDARSSAVARQARLSRIVRWQNGEHIAPADRADLAAQRQQARRTLAALDRYETAIRLRTRAESSGVPDRIAAASAEEDAAGRLLDTELARAGTSDAPGGDPRPATDVDAPPPTPRELLAAAHDATAEQRDRLATTLDTLCTALGVDPAQLTPDTTADTIARLLRRTPSQDIAHRDAIAQLDAIATTHQLAAEDTDRLATRLAAATEVDRAGAEYRRLRAQPDSTSDHLRAVASARAELDRAEAMLRTHEMRSVIAIRERLGMRRTAAAARGDIDTLTEAASAYDAMNARLDQLAARALGTAAWRRPSFADDAVTAAVERRDDAAGRYRELLRSATTGEDYHELANVAAEFHHADADVRRLDTFARLDARTADDDGDPLPDDPPPAPETRSDAQLDLIAERDAVQLSLPELERAVDVYRAEVGNVHRDQVTPERLWETLDRLRDNTPDTDATRRQAIDKLEEASFALHRRIADAARLDEHAAAVARRDAVAADRERLAADPRAAQQFAQAAHRFRLADAEVRRQEARADAADARDTLDRQLTVTATVLGVRTADLIPERLTGTLRAVREQWPDMPESVSALAAQAHAYHDAETTLAWLDERANANGPRASMLDSFADALVSRTEALDVDEFLRASAAVDGAAGRVSADLRFGNNGRSGDDAWSPGPSRNGEDLGARPWECVEGHTEFEEIAGDKFCAVCGNVREGGNGKHVELQPDMTAVAISDQGAKHIRNEDAVAVGVVDLSGKPGRYGVVCDGVSSSVDGPRAARAGSAAAERALRDGLTAGLPMEETIRGALRAAEEAVLTTGEPYHGKPEPPTCTIAAAVAHDGRVTVGWLGDSRVYWLGDDGIGRVLTGPDDEINGAVSLWLGWHDDAKNDAWLLSGVADAINGDSHIRSYPDFDGMPLGPGTVLLASDGMYKAYQLDGAGKPVAHLPDLHPDRMADVVAAHPGDMRASASALVELAQHGGSGDDTSVVLLRAAPTEPKTVPDTLRELGVPVPAGADPHELADALLHTASRLQEIRLRRQANLRELLAATTDPHRIERANREAAEDNSTLRARMRDVNRALATLTDVDPAIGHRPVPPAEAAREQHHVPRSEWPRSAADDTGMLYPNTELMADESGKVVGATNIGVSPSHPFNEDAMAMDTVEVDDRPLRVVVACDGVSSAWDSQYGSRAAADAVRDSLRRQLPAGVPADDAVAEAMRAAQRAMQEEAAGYGEDGPSATVAVAVVDSGRVTVGWAGDARAYWLDPETGTSLRLTRDDTLTSELMDNGMPESAALRQPGAHGIERWLGPDATDATVRTFLLPRDGVVLVCTDGLWGEDLHEAGALADVVDAQSGDLRAAAADLVDRALVSAKDKDNITVLLAEHQVAKSGPGGPVQLAERHIDLTHGTETDPRPPEVTAPVESRTEPAPHAPEPELVPTLPLPQHDPLHERWADAIGRRESAATAMRYVRHTRFRRTAEAGELEAVYRRANQQVRLLEAMRTAADDGPAIHSPLEFPRLENAAEPRTHTAESRLLRDVLAQFAKPAGRGKDSEPTADRLHKDIAEIRRLAESYDFHADDVTPARLAEPARADLAKAEAVWRDFRHRRTLLRQQKGTGSYWNQRRAARVDKYEREQAARRVLDTVDRINRDTARLMELRAAAEHLAVTEVLRAIGGTVFLDGVRLVDEPTPRAIVVDTDPGRLLDAGVRSELAARGYSIEYQRVEVDHAGEVTVTEQRVSAVHESIDPPMESGWRHSPAREFQPRSDDVSAAMREWDAARQFHRRVFGRVARFLEDHPELEIEPTLDANEVASALAERLGQTAVVEKPLWDLRSLLQETRQTGQVEQMFRREVERLATAELMNSLGLEPDEAERDVWRDPTHDQARIVVGATPETVWSAEQRSAHDASGHEVTYVRVALDDAGHIHVRELAPPPDRPEPPTVEHSEAWWKREYAGYTQKRKDTEFDQVKSRRNELLPTRELLRDQLAEIAEKFQKTLGDFRSGQTLAATLEELRTRTIGGGSYAGGLDEVPTTSQGEPAYSPDKLAEAQEAADRFNRSQAEIKELDARLRLLRTDYSPEEDETRGLIKDTVKLLASQVQRLGQARDLIHDLADMVETGRDSAAHIADLAELSRTLGNPVAGADDWRAPLRSVLFDLRATDTMPATMTTHLRELAQRVQTEQDWVAAEHSRLTGEWRVAFEAEGGRMLTDHIGVIDVRADPEGMGERHVVVFAAPRPGEHPPVSHERALREALDGNNSTIEPQLAEAHHAIARILVDSDATIVYRKVTLDADGNPSFHDLAGPLIQRTRSAWRQSDGLPYPSTTMGLHVRMVAQMLGVIKPRASDVVAHFRSSERSPASIERYDFVSWQDSDGKWHVVDPAIAGRLAVKRDLPLYFKSPKPSEHSQNDQFTPIEYKFKADGYTGWGSEPLFNSVDMGWRVGVAHENVLVVGGYEGSVDELEVNKVAEDALFPFPGTPSVEYQVPPDLEQYIQHQHLGAEIYNMKRLLIDILRDAFNKHAAVHHVFQTFPAIGDAILRASDWFASPRLTAHTDPIVKYIPGLRSLRTYKHYFADWQKYPQPMFEGYEPAEHAGAPAAADHPTDAQQRARAQWAEVQEWADGEYMKFLGGDKNIDTILDNIAGRSTIVLTADDVLTAKNHIMRDEHLFQDRATGLWVRRRFDRLADVAEAMNRLTSTAGNSRDRVLDSDVEMLEDALLESTYERDHPDATWEDSNRATAFHNKDWDSHRPPLTEWRKGISYAVGPMDRVEEPVIWHTNRELTRLGSAPIAGIARDYIENARNGTMVTDRVGILQVGSRTRLIVVGTTIDGTDHTRQLTRAIAESDDVRDALDTHGVQIEYLCADIDTVEGLMWLGDVNAAQVHRVAPDLQTLLRMPPDTDSPEAEREFTHSEHESAEKTNESANSGDSPRPPDHRPTIAPTPPTDPLRTLRRGPHVPPYWHPQPPAPQQTNPTGPALLPPAPPPHHSNPAGPLPQRPQTGPMPPSQGSIAPGSSEITSPAPGPIGPDGVSPAHPNAPGHTRPHPHTPTHHGPHPHSPNHHAHSPTETGPEPLWPLPPWLTKLPWPLSPPPPPSGSAESDEDRPHE